MPGSGKQKMMIIEGNGEPNDGFNDEEH